jgi:hypothetical protein
MAPVKLGDLLYLDDGDLRDNVTVIAVCPPDRTGRVLGPLRVVNVTRKPNRVDMEFEPFITEDDHRRSDEVYYRGDLVLEMDFDASQLDPSTPYRHRITLWSDGKV